MQKKTTMLALLSLTLLLSSCGNAADKKSEESANQGTTSSLVASSQEKSTKDEKTSSSSTSASSREASSQGTADPESGSGSADSAKETGEDKPYKKLPVKEGQTQDIDGLLVSLPEGWKALELRDASLPKMKRTLLFGRNQKEKLGVLIIHLQEESVNKFTDSKTQTYFTQELQYGFGYKKETAKVIGPKTIQGLNSYFSPSGDELESSEFPNVAVTTLYRGNHCYQYYLFSGKKLANEEQILQQLVQASTFLKSEKGL